MLTGGRFAYGGQQCTGGGTRLCVLIVQASQPIHVSIGALYPQANWVGIGTNMSRDEALQLQEPNFWTSPNCGQGCASALVYTFADGNFVGEQTLSQ